MSHSVEQDLMTAHAIASRQRGLASPDGHCRAFAPEAQGTVFGSGVGLVVLKSLEAALNDGDSIHAVIRGRRSTTTVR